MKGASPPLRLGKCETCHARFAPGDGPCPKCGSAATSAYEAPALATVLASTEVAYPPPGWEKPHYLAFVELEDAVRLLVVPDPPLPPAGAVVEVRTDGAVYRCRPTEKEGEERGEGDSPKTGEARPSFEPPR